MEKTEFLEQHLFNDLTNLNKESEADDSYQFSEADFEIVLQRAEHFGLGVFTIESWHNGVSTGVSKHEDFRKKATDAKWYKKAFLTSRKGQAGLTYAGTYKISSKLLSRETFQEDEE